MDRDQEFVLNTVKYLVENPDDVKVDRKIDEMGVLLTLTVNPADMGKIIGKEGRTAKAIRTLLRVIGAKMDARVNLKIEEPEGSTYVRPVSTDPLRPQSEASASQGGPSADAAAMSGASDDAATTSSDDSASSDDSTTSDDNSSHSQRTAVSDDSGFSQPSAAPAVSVSDAATDFDPLATSKSIYGEDAASAGSNLDTDTSKTESDENPTSIL